MLGQTNFEKTLPDPVMNQTNLTVRDKYTFDFLELGAEQSERELERAKCLNNGDGKWRVRNKGLKLIEALRAQQALEQ